MGIYISISNNYAIKKLNSLNNNVGSFTKYSKNRFIVYHSPLLHEGYKVLLRLYKNSANLKQEKKGHSYKYLITFTNMFLYLVYIIKIMLSNSFCFMFMENITV